jgi:hypothetical protein
VIRRRLAVAGVCLVDGSLTTGAASAAHGWGRVVILAAIGLLWAVTLGAVTLGWQVCRGD